MMMMKGRRERKMKKITNQVLVDSNLLFKIFSSPWEQVAVFLSLFLPLVPSCPASAVSSLLYTMVLILLGGGGGDVP